MSDGWTSGNKIQLLENGEEFFPRILDVIRGAQREILLETFIIRDDKVGQLVKQVLIQAAGRGVQIALTVDGYGSYFLPAEFITELSQAGVVFSMYDPPPKWMSFRTNVFRRLHRKLLVVDGRVAFVGGINLSYNHLCEYGPEGKQDYAVEVHGPIVNQIRHFMIAQLHNHFEVNESFNKVSVNEVSESKGSSEIVFATRDNDRHHTDIEGYYLQQVRAARHHITIANAYFFPGYRLLKELRNAARRGVKVRLVIQGKPGSTLAMKTAPMLYEFLVESDIDVYEYWERPLHGKIAAIDDEWSTVGSSNLDPLSLSLNLEANLFIRDKQFNAQLQRHMEKLMQQSKIRKINDNWIHRRTLWKWMRTMVVFHFLRHFPAWAGWLPAHTPRIVRGTSASDKLGSDYKNTHYKDTHENC